jgi:hypothetical protein
MVLDEKEIQSLFDCLKHRPIDCWGPPSSIPPLFMNTEPFLHNRKPDHKYGRLEGFRFSYYALVQNYLTFLCDMDKDFFLILRQKPLCLIIILCYIKN